MLGSHLIFCAYGFWLPNEERGSWSTTVRAQHLYEVGGDATKVDVRRSLAGKPHDRNARLAAKAALVRPAVEFNGQQARAIGRGIAELSRKLSLTVHALAIVPDHVHLVAADHTLHGDELIAALKRAGTRGMNAEGLHPLANHPRKSGRLPSPWAEGGWKTFLNTPEEMWRAIEYVECNPMRAGLRPQRWACVVSYDG